MSPGTLADMCVSVVTHLKGFLPSANWVQSMSPTFTQGLNFELLVAVEQTSAKMQAWVKESSLMFAA